MSVSAAAAVPANALRAGERAVRAAYYAFVLWIPVETIFFFKNEGSADGITLSRPIGIVLFGLALIEWRACFRRIPSVFWLIAWYMGVYSLSQMWIPRELDEPFLRQRFVMVQNIAFFLISANLFSDGEFRGSLLRSYGWWISVVAAGMMTGTFGGQSVELDGRSTLLGQDPNVTAGFYAFGAICIAGDDRFFASRGLGARVFAASAAVCVLIAAILQTGSRGGLMVLVAGVLGLVMCGDRSSRGRRLAIACAIAAALSLQLVREFRRESLSASRLMDAWGQGDTAGRTGIFRVAWSMFLDQPLLGYGGINNLFTLGSRLNYGATLRATHNMLLSVLTSVGLAGAVPFLAALVCALWTAWRYGRRTGAAVPFALMCALLIFNLSISGEDLRIFWIILAAAVGCGIELKGAHAAA